MPINNYDSFSTERLLAERLQEDHFELIYKMHQDEKVMAHLGGKRSRQETEEYMKQALAHWKKHEYGIWILYEISTGLFVGRGGLRNSRLGGNLEVEVAYGLLPEFWNKGLATEFAKSVVKMAFVVLGFSNLVCISVPDNLASLRVMEKTGFHYERDIISKDKLHLMYRQYDYEYATENGCL
jgi:ribosomal-protein-alanine N-acetyltransferase